MRTLRQGDVNLNHQIIAVNRKAGKNRFRRREVPLTDGSCLWAVQKLMERSYELVGKSPELYLFPSRVVRNQFNGNFHMSETGVRKQFEAIRDLAAVPWFRLNGWRHTAITRMAEAGVPIATIMARAGHCSPKMSAHYTHISSQAERFAMQRMGQGRKTIPAEAAQLRSDLAPFSKPISAGREINEARHASAFMEQTIAPQKGRSAAGFHVTTNTWFL
jgi:integrase